LNYGGELPLITIGVPTKNRAWTIRKILKALDSIEYPTHLLKVVFVDDYSTDDTYEIICEWASKASEKGFHKVEVIRARTNIPQARNLCVKKMEGKYLLFWDSDVIPPPELLREMVDIIERNLDIGIIGADYIYEPSTGIKYKPVINKGTHAVYMGFTLIRREIFEKVGLFNENLSVGEDTEFGIRVRERTSYRIIWAPKPVLHLKRLEEVRKPGALRTWLWYNFTVRAGEYYNSWKTLPSFLKLRIAYWLMWPWIVGLLVYVAIMGKTLLALCLLTYVGASAYPVVQQKGVRHGIRLWIGGNVLTGLALSYGVLKEAMKTLISKTRF